MQGSVGRSSHGGSAVCVWGVSAEPSHKRGPQPRGEAVCPSLFPLQGGRAEASPNAWRREGLNSSGTGLDKRSAPGCILLMPLVNSSGTQQVVL